MNEVRSDAEYVEAELIDGQEAQNGQEAQEAHAAPSEPLADTEAIDVVEICLLYTSPSPRDSMENRG